ncbi:MAG TPA: metal-dependent transcriptional regulator [Candidatus Polarisedimenticolaceae bacterium]|nr:metal-dependent transcriptional regulator [Candidatus Polarisedimenticolaceae bacterium]
MPTSTVEDYLKRIYLEEQAAPAARIPTGQIAQALGVTPGTATAMIKTLAESGLVDYEAYSGVRLMEAGRHLAAHVVRRHRLVEAFLVEVMGMNWSEVHAEAEILEHAVSDRLIDRIDEMLGRPAFDPHGDPIPTAGGELAPPGAHESLIACPIDADRVVARVTDQRTDFLRLVEAEGLMPGRRVSVKARDPLMDTVEVWTEGGRSVRLGFRAASRVLVLPWPKSA